MRNAVLPPAATVDEYIARFPPSTRKLLIQLRSLVKKNAPAATESISYRMAAYSYNGPLLYFAAYDHHIGFYPMAVGKDHFKSELTAYKTSKGAIQFPLDKPLPRKLITAMIMFKVKYNEYKAATKKTVKKTRRSYKG